jgi:hypothetical protein
MKLIHKRFKLTELLEMVALKAISIMIEVEAMNNLSYKAQNDW